MKNKMLLTALFAIVLWSCEKEDSENGESEKTDLLVQQAWTFESAGFDLGSDGSVELDMTAQLPACLTDNTLSFAANGNGTVNEGATKCAPTDPQTSPFTWSFANGETMLNIDGNVVAGVEDGGQFKVVTLSSTQLTLAKDTTQLGFAGALVATFKH